MTEADGLYQPVFSVRGLPGAVYEITAAEDIITPDGTRRASAGEVVDTVTTDETGLAESKPLYLGKYEIREITAPGGYVLNTEIRTAELAYAGQEIEIAETAADFYNERQKATVSLDKVLEQNEQFGIGMNGSLVHYFELFRRERRMQGGFIWDWVDQGIEKSDAKGRKFYAYGGDFGDFPNDFDFCCNGMIWPDRVPHPSMFEFKYLAKPFTIRAAELSAGVFELVNYHYFKTLDELAFSYRIEVDGEVVDRGALELPSVMPQSQARFTVPWHLPELGRNQEAFIIFTAAQKSAAPWAEAGFEVGHEQFKLELPPPAGAASALPAAKLERSGDTVAVGDSVLVFGAAGVPESWKFRGVELLAAAPAEQFLRGATDNDAIRCFIHTDERKVGFRWLEVYGLDGLEAESSPAEFRMENGVFTAESAAVYTAKNKAKLIVKRSLALLETGALAVNLEFDVPPELDDLPRLGWRRCAMSISRYRSMPSIARLSGRLYAISGTGNIRIFFVESVRLHQNFMYLCYMLCSLSAIAG